MVEMGLHIVGVVMVVELVVGVVLQERKVLLVVLVLLVRKAQQEALVLLVRKAEQAAQEL
jgi:hypothetical protein